MDVGDDDNADDDETTSVHSTCLSDSTTVMFYFFVLNILMMSKVTFRSQSSIECQKYKFKVRKVTLRSTFLFFEVIGNINIKNITFDVKNDI